MNRLLEPMSLSASLTEGILRSLRHLLQMTMMMSWESRFRRGELLLKFVKSLSRIAAKWLNRHTPRMRQ